MKLKKSIALIMGIVLIFTALSGAFLYNESQRDVGGVSTVHPKYEFTTVDGSAYRQILPDNVLNGSISKIEGCSYWVYDTELEFVGSYNVTPEEPTPITGSLGDVYYFYPQFPFMIQLDQPLNVYLHFYDHDGNEQSIFISLDSGRSEHITLDYIDRFIPEPYPLSYYMDVSQPCWLSVTLTNTDINRDVVLKKVIIRSGAEEKQLKVTSVIAESRNLISTKDWYTYTGEAAEELESGNGILVPPETKILTHAVSLKPGVYTMDMESYNADGDFFNRFCYVYSDGTSSDLAPFGDPLIAYDDVSFIRVYKYEANEPLSSPLEATNIRFMRYVEWSEYTPYFDPYILYDIPDSLVREDFYGIGDNYIDFDRGVYVIYYDSGGYRDQPREIPLSRYGISGKPEFSLYNVGAIRFENEDQLDVGFLLHYRSSIE